MHPGSDNRVCLSPPSSPSGRGNGLAKRGRGEGVRRTILRGIASALTLLPLLCIATAPHPTQPRPANNHPLTFGRDVRPILAGNCFKCHGPDPEVRQGGLRLDTREGATTTLKDGAHAVVPADPDNSRLIQLVTSTDLDERMPPVEVSKHGLKPEDIDTLRCWIREGAPYERHWSFVAPLKKSPPAVTNEKWCRKDLDRWVLSRLEREGAKPSPEAPRETLLRRVSLDLIGLPPSPAELDAFLADKSPDAYEKAVDRLLASPRFGEKWARWWLDLARYADTRGYEKDDRRTVWPYRDWVIRAFNADMPFDQFTIEQLAGDLLPGATRDQLIATAFHRNTMTNDEGGTDDEEFRVAAVVDRVNTTMEVWQGLTMACAQCHTHKYDPITHADYYRMFAIFNNTADADTPDEAPLLRLLSPEDETALAAAQKKLDDAERRITEQVAKTPRDSYHPPPQPPKSVEMRDYAWLDDVLPARATPKVQNLSPAWPWIPRETLAPASGALCFSAKSAGGAAQQYVEKANPSLEAAEGDLLYVHAYLDPKDPPKQIMLQWFTDDGGWEHRAYWGELKQGYGGKAGTASLLHLGDLPEPGKWVRLEIDPRSVGLVGNPITGWAFSQFDGTVYWDNAGLRTPRVIDDRYLISIDAWLDRVRPDAGAGLPPEIAALVKAPARSPDQEAALVEYYLRNVHAPTRTALVTLEMDAAARRSEVAAINARAVSLPVMRELAGDQRRRTHRFVRGSFLNPAEEVTPGAPEVFADVSASSPTNRLELAQWVMSPENPLTARVIANRFWEQLWGSGIVETVEDFGTQGLWPSDQELLDHLAVRLRDGGWSVKAFLRYVVTSATYRQSSAVADDLLARDPYNRLFARGPRFRLDGETIRDSALAAGGVLSDKMFGPPVFPPQPDGLWIMVYSSDRWMTSKGEDRYRRGVYTFWRRTVPYPAMTTFDAPSREFCVSRRLRTNTPLQSLVTLNDPAYVECAQAMSRRVLREGGESDAARLAHAMKLAVARTPSPDETRRLAELLKSERAHYRNDAAAAQQAATVPLGPLPDGTDPTDAAAWAAVCNVILNLDETLTKE